MQALVRVYCFLNTDLINSEHQWTDQASIFLLERQNQKSEQN